MLHEATIEASQRIPASYCPDKESAKAWVSVRTVNQWKKASALARSFADAGTETDRQRERERERASERASEGEGERERETNIKTERGRRMDVGSISQSSEP